MPHDTTPTKRCTRCREVLPATEQFFMPHKVSSRGLRSRCRVCVQEYEAQHPNQIGDAGREYMRTYRKRPGVKAKLRESTRKWEKAHPEVSRVHAHKRRMRKRNAEGQHTAADIKAQHKRQKGRCYYCSAKLGKSYHVDHIVPLSRGGSDGPENLVCACPSCNLSKKDKLPHEWPQGGRLL